MPSYRNIELSIALDVAVERTPRVLQCEGIFDVGRTTKSTTYLDVRLPLAEKEWSVGLIVGPSGSGKTTVAREIWPDIITGYEWPPAESILDGFSQGLSVRDILRTLSAVGFSSPPAWLRPFRALSNGEQFRVTLARALLEAGSEPVVVDEFTSVIDRTVAKICSTAVSKVVRDRNKQFVAVSCHYDIVDWLQPDWVYEPAGNLFRWRYLQRRPNIELTIQRVHYSAWEIFKHHHYLSTDLNVSANCIMASMENHPVAISAWIAQPHGRVANMRRESRIVVLPDYQGIGIGHALSSFVASAWKGLRYKPTVTTTHPAVIRAREKSSDWELRRSQSFLAGGGMFSADTSLGKTRSRGRLTSSFRYVGPAMPAEQARALLGTF